MTQERVTPTWEPTTQTAVRERPIIFQGPKVSWILAQPPGALMQTRRVVQFPKGLWSGAPVTEYLGAPYGTHRFHVADHGDMRVRCPYGQPGNRLWVRESFATFTGDEGTSGILYRADPMFGTCKPGDFGWDWKSPIHMPRWASRLTLEIHEVRVQRVQEISEEDAQAEGFTKRGVWWDMGENWEGDGIGYPDAVDGFRVLWDTLNARCGYSWESNPWVFAITFTRVWRRPMPHPLRETPSEPSPFWTSGGGNDGGR